MSAGRALQSAQAAWWVVFACLAAALATWLALPPETVERVMGETGPVEQLTAGTYALCAIAIEASELQKLPKAAAIQFASEESIPLEQLLNALLLNLQGSDFLAAFPDHRTICTIHHHKQIWWQTASGEIAAALRAIAQRGNQSTQSSSS